MYPRPLSALLETPVAESDVDLIQGTLNVLILKTLSWGPMNGYAIAQWVREATEGDIELEEGALYPALHRMEHRGWLSAEWGLSENNRRAKFYRLTPLGRRTLRARTDSWERLVSAVGRVLSAQPRTA
jgi:PadR family transcriptional regulator PadR